MTEENINQETQIEETKNWDGITILLLVLSGLLLVFSFFAPYLFTRPSLNDDFDFTDKGTIGDAIGGLMNPFIALVGVLLTFLAFYMQIKANKIQRELFYKGLQENKRQFDQELNANREQLNDQLAIQTHQFKKSEFESQFYEMLKLHKENVNEVSISRKVKLKYDSRNSELKYVDIKGRKAFEEILVELEKCYDAAKKTFNSRDKNYWLERAYKVFFFGINSNENGIKRYYFRVENELKNLGVDSTFYDNIKSEFPAGNEYLSGYATLLAHLYRHLFQIVKFISVQDENLITYEEKRKYIRILRAQLSNPEQALLFYNWKSGFGSQWENDSNKFFTDYRMIHNIYDSLMLDDFNPEIEFESQIRQKLYRKEKGRNWDPLFEFEDWK
ncbi:MAG: putative phage abortive infection protein [Flavobacterium sp.]|nr:putative phage abortive infection protein [Flavobacterium sp.]